MSAAVQPFCEAAPGLCAFPDCDCDCNCGIPSLDGAGQHSPGCRCIVRAAGCPPPESSQGAE